MLLATYLVKRSSQGLIIDREWIDNDGSFLALGHFYGEKMHFLWSAQVDENLDIDSDSVNEIVIDDRTIEVLKEIIKDKF